MQEPIQHSIKVIIGLGNPGQQYYLTRHSIGFRVLDELASKYYSSWRPKENMEMYDITINDQAILLVKPQTFMNSSGKVIPYLAKQGIKAENILVVHDELEKPFGKLAFKSGGSHRGHNGLRSIIDACGPEFMRLRFGIGRPEDKNDVGNYVLRRFDQDSSEIESCIQQAIEMIEALFFAGPE